MEFLQDPNVVYLMLSGGLIFAVLSLASPGTGYLEIGALFILGVAGWGIAAYDLPINLWALFLMIAGAVFFAISVYRSKPWSWLVVSILALVLGSAYLFHGEEWYLPAVNPLLAATVSLLSGGFFWIAGRKAAEAAVARPTHDLEGLIGLIGEAKTPVHAEGSVLVASELWSASSDQPIQNGERVRVVGRQGFTLLVEPLEKDQPTS